ncbi:TPA: DNA-binding protein [Candidatus Woesearchaeota archaeon]|nr:DNA-binding protein [Candidatus Woesearchaeota archaeon]HIH04700.1 DNA-binding protein [Candidatus Woesearchaeota archaeon]HII64382.1 DNA-binding protein [Candidatus Woesearchaeota archaeon]
MKVKELQSKQGNVNIELDILDVGPSREFQKFGKPGRVSTAVAKDDTGDVKLTLWNDEIDQVKGGDRIRITNGYVSEWQGELQVSTGRFGKIEVIGENPDTHKGEDSSAAAQKKQDDDGGNGPVDDEEDVI